MCGEGGGGAISRGSELTLLVGLTCAAAVSPDCVFPQFEYLCYQILKIGPTSYCQPTIKFDRQIKVDGGGGGSGECVGVSSCSS